jgi:serine/threonine protein phosphatase PrpC
MTYQHTYGAASVTGQAHIGSALPNQDACLVREYSFGHVLAVADGLGSKPLSNIGSRAVCEAASIWSRRPAAPVRHFVRLIHALWEMRVAPHAPAECGTTCLFTILLKNGRLICGQLGDGLIAYATPGAFHIVRVKDDAFTNISQSMHSVTRFDEWTCVDVDLGSEPVSILMATDGVSEDLVPETRHQFLEHLKAMVLAQPTLRQRNSAIRQALLDWPAKYSNDDKTVILFHRGVTTDEG